MREDGTAGPLGGATELLLACLAATNVPVRLERPDDSEDGPPALTVWPVTLLPDRAMAAGLTREPWRLRIRHLVCAGGPADVALDLLDRVLVLESLQSFLVTDPVPAELWPLLGVRSRLGLFFELPVQVARPQHAVAPRVTALPEVQGVAMRSVTGQVVGPGGVPIPGMRVTAADGTSTTSTDSRGNFVLAGVAADRSVRLLLTGRGVRLSAEVAAGPAEPVVITCEI